MARDAKAVAKWDFERIIPCHGVSTLGDTTFKLVQLTEDFGFLGHH